MSEKKKHRVWKEPAFLLGVVLTVVISALFAYSLFCLPVVAEEQSYTSKWAYLKTASPNEIGDTLAGVAGSLAFVWIVVTVWLQATELREQRVEFEKMAEAQGDQVDLLVKQGKIFEDEQRQRMERQAHDKLDEQLISLCVLLAEHPKVAWSIATGNDKPMDAFRTESLLPITVNPEIIHLELPRVARRFSKSLVALRNAADTGGFNPEHEFPKSPLRGFGLSTALEDLSNTKEDLSEAQRIRFDRLRIESSQHFLEEIFALPIWTEVEPPKGDDVQE